MYNQGTWIGPEEDAYNTYHGGHSRSRRKAMALCQDGKVRKVTCGIPDTFFTIPAHCVIKGKYASGYLSIDTDKNVVVFRDYNEG